eukprot:3661673-Rhodomonas_salina.1
MPLSHDEKSARNRAFRWYLFGEKRRASRAGDGTVIVWLGEDHRASRVGDGTVMIRFGKEPPCSSVRSWH